MDVFELQTCVGDFPGGSVVKNPPANAEDFGLIPDPGGSHMLQSSVNQCATAIEPVFTAWEPQLLNPPHVLHLRSPPQGCVT